MRLREGRGGSSGPGAVPGEVQIASSPAGHGGGLRRREHRQPPGPLLAGLGLPGGDGDEVWPWRVIVSYLSLVL